MHRAVRRAREVGDSCDLTFRRNPMDDLAKTPANGRARFASRTSNPLTGDRSYYVRVRPFT